MPTYFRYTDLLLTAVNFSSVHVFSWIKYILIVNHEAKLSNENLPNRVKTFLKKGKIIYPPIKTNIYKFDLLIKNSSNHTSKVPFSNTLKYKSFLPTNIRLQKDNKLTINKLSTKVSHTLSKPNKNQQ